MPSIQIPYYLGSFNTDYILFPEMLKFLAFVFPNNKNLWGNYWIFKNIPLVEMKISHYLVIQQICVEGAKVVYIPRFN
jgi:hypothetical protein